MVSVAPLEAVPCDLCGRDDAAPLVIKHAFRVVRCRGCELVYVNPRPRPAALAALYDVDAFADGQAERAEDAAWTASARARLALLDRYQPTRGALLDVGCSTGWFLAVARAGGWQASGIDLAPASVAYCRRKGFDARVATLETCDLPRGRFAAATLFDSIEHMPSPMRALAIVHDLLAPGGIVMITTPNIDGLFPRLTYRLFARTLGAWEHPGPPGHVYQFSRRTLAAALDRAGFAIEHDATEAIDLEHTANALANALLLGLKRRTRPVRAPDAIAPIDLTPPPPRDAGGPTEGNGGRGGAGGNGAKRVLKRAVRAAVETASWAMVGAVAVPAAWIDRGDSLVVIARKR